MRYLLAITLFSILITAAVNDLQVNTKYGPIIGQYEANSVREFLGIPYAAPPVGELRWAPTQPPNSWNEPLNCTSFGPACPQNISPLFNPKFDEQFEYQNEDCLTMNIWTPPEIPDGELVPVMIFVYGGGFQSGSSNDLMLNGSNLTYSENVIVVNFNYRLGCLGFLAVSEIAKVNPNFPTNGNWGIFDQQMAFLFIKQNIQFFGGDPNRVMIFGESAGGNSMFDHLASPLSAGLFQRVGIESGYYHGLLPLAQAETMGEFVVQTFNCTDLSPSETVDCLRAIPVELILSMTSSCFFQPTIDGVQFTEQPNEAVINGNFNRVPTLLGANHNELAIFAVTGLPKNMTVSEYNKYFSLLWNVFGLPKNQKQEAMNLYSLDEFPSPFWSLVAAFTDWNFKCSNRRFASLLTNQNVPAFLYQFSAAPDNNAYWNYEEFLGVYHTAELQYVFQTFNSFSLELGKKVSENTMKYWANFARNGNPNSDGELSWPQYDNTMDENIDISYSLSTQVGMGNATRCDFWNNLPDYTAGASCKPSQDSSILSAALRVFPWKSSPNSVFSYSVNQNRL